MLVPRDLMSNERNKGRVLQPSGSHSLNQSWLADCLAGGSKWDESGTSTGIWANIKCHRVAQSFSRLKGRDLELLPVSTLHLGSWHCLWFESPENLARLWPWRHGLCRSTEGLIMSWKKRWLRFHDRGRRKKTGQPTKLTHHGGKWANTFLSWGERGNDGLDFSHPAHPH